MPAKIPKEIEERIVRLHLLEGDSLERISDKVNVSKGGVYDVTQRRKKELGASDYDAVRSFVIEAKKKGMTILQCDIGYRIHNRIKQELGLGEDLQDREFEEIEEGIIESYAEGKKMGLSPHELALNAKALSNISKTENIAPTDLSSHIEKKREQILDCNRQIDRIEREKEKAEKQARQELQKNKLKIETIDQYLRTKAELAKYGIDIDNGLEKFAITLKNIEQLGYDSGEIIKTSCKCESVLDEIIGRPTGAIPFDEKLERAYHTYCIGRNFEAIEMTPEGSRKIRNVLKAIARAEKLPYELVTEKFVRDVDEQYERKAGFERAVTRANLEKMQIERDIDASKTRSSVVYALQYLEYHNIPPEEFVKDVNLIRSFGRDNVRRACEALQKGELNESPQTLGNIRTISRPPYWSENEWCKMFRPKPEIEDEESYSTGHRIGYPLEHPPKKKKMERIGWPEDDLESQGDISDIGRP